jgi:hypothetical protein
VRTFATLLSAAAAGTRPLAAGQPETYGGAAAADKGMGFGAPAGEPGRGADDPGGPFGIGVLYHQLPGREL